jgi:hypothetical protein
VANRSYLYSTNAVPGTKSLQEKPKLRGIAEWNYDVPLVFKLLLSGNPRPCQSSIWEVTEAIAIAGDYGDGVERLTRFLKEIQAPIAQPVIQEALAFLADDSNRNLYFVLESGEIFEMEEEPLAEQNRLLIEEIGTLDAVIKDALLSIEHPQRSEVKKPSFLSKMFGSSPTPTDETVDLLKKIHSLGLGAWSNALYFSGDA